MLRTKVAGVAVAAAALAAGPLSAGPAHAQPVAVKLPCEIFAYPYGYPCETAEDVGNFVLVEAWDAQEFVVAMRDEAGEVVFRAYCTVFPNQPECP